MTVKELRDILAQFDENMEIKVVDDFGYWEECNSVTLITTENYEIDKDYIVIESK